MLFSERNGYKPIRDVFQKESIDAPLRNGLWNVLDTNIWQKHQSVSHYSYTDHSNLRLLIRSYYHSFFKKTLDSIPLYITDSIKFIRQQFFSAEWHIIYSFIEFTLEDFPNFCNRKTFTDQINGVLERENSAYRIINDLVTEITSEQEIQSIDEAMQVTGKFSSVQQHLQTALKLMSDRQNPDYRNSIKESISAVESICKIVTADNSATLGKALKLVDDKYGLHPALKSSLSSLYGYTSDADGIRHAMMEESNLTFMDAKFMLVSCTNFINYLVSKTKT